MLRSIVSHVIYRQINDIHQKYAIDTSTTVNVRATSRSNPRREDSLLQFALRSPICKRPAIFLYLGAGLLNSEPVPLLFP